MTDFSASETLTAEALNAAFDAAADVPPADAPLLGTIGEVFTPVTPGGGVVLAGGTLSANWRGGLVTALGGGLMLNAGTLSATGTGGSVTAVVAGAGMGGGTITTSGTLTARTAARMQVEWPAGAVVNNGTIFFAFDPPYAGAINSLTHFCNIGSFTAAIQCNGTNVTGLGTITPTGTVTTTTALGANTFIAGQRIGAVITSASTNAADALLSLNVTWSN